MAEAEEVISDAARHATVFVRDLWQRHRPAGAPLLVLADVASRLDLIVTSVFGTSYPIRTAQLPPPPTLLDRLFGRRRLPRFDRPLPATDGNRIWLPAELGIADRSLALKRYRTMALQQAMRAHRGSAGPACRTADPLVSDVYLVLEALAADAALAGMLPGLRSSLDDHRRSALAGRPPLADLPQPVRPLESFLRGLLESGAGAAGGCDTSSPAASLESASTVARRFRSDRARGQDGRRLPGDWWTGELRPPTPEKTELRGEAASRDAEEETEPARSARLARRPQVREAKKGEDDDREKDGTWMVQADEPHRKGEDPMGLQRPTDRGEESPDALGDMLTELPELRTVGTPGRPKEYLLSDDPPDSRLRLTDLPPAGGVASLCYPEWNWRDSAYERPGATVRLLPPRCGPQAWVDRTLDEHRAMLRQIRRRFEMLRARRVVLRKRQDGDEIDLEACIDAMADLRAGSYMDEGLYRSCRPVDRNMAITLLIDVSGSTDAWVSAGRRIVDVEREALLLVAIALEELGEPYAIQAFSGEGRDHVTVRELKPFGSPFDNGIALRIASLEPERYTRAGAAIRHATAGLMRQAADHRLLLVLSDGKPNDVDCYEGRYGIEDMHRAVTEARLQGIFPFCLTIDRQAASYLPRIFGANQYALLQRPALLPTALLDWMRRLVSAR